MKLRTLLLLFLILCSVASNAQDSLKYYIRRGIAMAKIGDYPAAMRNLDRAIVLDSTRSEAWYNRGVVKTETGDYAGAVSDLTQAIRLKPTYAQPWFRRAAAKEKLD